MVAREAARFDDGCKGGGGSRPCRVPGGAPSSTCAPRPVTGGCTYLHEQPAPWRRGRCAAGGLLPQRSLLPSCSQCRAASGRHPQHQLCAIILSDLVHCGPEMVRAVQLHVMECAGHGGRSRRAPWRGGSVGSSGHGKECAGTFHGEAHGSPVFLCGRPRLRHPCPGSHCAGGPTVNASWHATSTYGSHATADPAFAVARTQLLTLVCDQLSAW